MSREIFKKTYFGFVYLWYDIDTKMFYLGSHLGSMHDSYLCSSKWMKRAHRRRKSSFRRRILELCRVDNKKQLHEMEQRWLNFMPDELLGKRYYNLKKTANGGGWPKGKKRGPITPERSAKLSATTKGRPWSEARRCAAKEHPHTAWNKGLPGINKGKKMPACTEANNRRWAKYYAHQAASSILENP